MNFLIFVQTFLCLVLTLAVSLSFSWRVYCTASKNFVQCGLFCFRHFSREILPYIECSNIGSLLFLTIVLFVCSPFQSKTWGVLLGFLSCSSFLPKYGNLTMWCLQFQEFSQLLCKRQLSRITGEWEIWKMSFFHGGEKHEMFFYSPLENNIF